jgi:hypothetical protein
MRNSIVFFVLVLAMQLIACRDGNVVGDVADVAPIRPEQASDPAAAGGSGAVPVDVDGPMTEPGRLSVSGERPGALFIDGVPAGVDAPVRDLEVAAGRHTIQVLYDNNELSPVRPVIVRAAQPVGIFLRAPSFTEGSGVAVAPAEGSDGSGEGSDEGSGEGSGDAVGTTPRGTVGIGAEVAGTVFIDGMRTTHRTPWLAEIPTGEYRFQVLYDDGRLSRQIEIDLEPGGRREVTFTGTDMFVLR